ncbi:MAG: RHS repeat-associated core domain-containing protein [Cyclobacteriaceae bacterium]
MQKTGHSTDPLTCDIAWNNPLDQMDVPVNKYLYNGKEFQSELGLDLALYDYGARFFDLGIARFTTVDPLASICCSWSTYHYAANDPIRMVDIGGMGWGDGLVKFVQEAASATLEFGAGVGNALASNMTSISSFDGSQTKGLVDRQIGGTTFTGVKD